MFEILVILKSLMEWIEFITSMFEILVISFALLLNTLSLPRMSGEARELYLFS